MEMSVSFTLQPLYFWYPLDRRMGRPQSWFGCTGKEKNPCHFRESNPDRIVFSEEYKL
jgi:hypothetical protein